MVLGSRRDRVLFSWVLFVLLVSAVTFLVYDSGWVELSREPKPMSVRLELVGLVFGLALCWNLLCRLVPSIYRVEVVRAFWGGVLVALVVWWVGFRFADRYLGWHEAGATDWSGFYLLMYEGWGMGFPILAIGFGVLVFFREGMESWGDDPSR